MSPPDKDCDAGRENDKRNDYHRYNYNRLCLFGARLHYSGNIAVVFFDFNRVAHVRVRLEVHPFERRCHYFFRICHSVELERKIAERLAGTKDADSGRSGALCAFSAGSNDRFALSVV